MSTAVVQESRRRHERTETSGRVHGEVADAESETMIGRAFEGSIVEISPCGLRIETDLEVAVGILDMWVYLAGFNRKIFLSCEVRWTECVDDDLYRVGVEIIANPLCDLEAWCEFQREQWFLHKSG